MDFVRHVVLPQQFHLIVPQPEVQLQKIGQGLGFSHQLPVPGPFLLPGQNFLKLFFFLYYLTVKADIYHISRIRAIILKRVKRYSLSVKLSAYIEKELFLSKVSLNFSRLFFGIPVFSGWISTTS